MRQTFETETLYFQQTYPEQYKFNEVYGFVGSQGQVHTDAVMVRPKDRPSKTVLIFMHPATAIDALPVPQAYAAAGLHVLCARSRYLRNDTALIFEKVILDLGAWVRYAREVLKYDKVVISGWSGGGPLSAFYQSQAERPTISSTPAGDPIDIPGAGLVAGDAVIFQAGSISRARILLEAIDASVRDEANPDDRDPNLDLYSPHNASLIPYSAEFLATYRQAQLARMRRITDWVKDMLETLKARSSGEVERAFVVHRTMADPRYLDSLVDPNERTPGRCLFGPPIIANSSPAGFARYSSLRSWLSQWSIDDSRADAVKSISTVSAPFLAIENGADDGAPPSHMREVFSACNSEVRRYHYIKGADHYYAGQPEHLDEAVGVVLNFLGELGLEDLDPSSVLHRPT